MPRRLFHLTAVFAVLAICRPLLAAPARSGALTIPYLQGQPECQVFARDGYLTLYAPGDSRGQDVPIQEGRFTVPVFTGKRSAIVMLREFETMPIIVPDLEPNPGVFAEYEIPIQSDYVRIAPDYASWDAKYATTGSNFWQAFIARSSALYNVFVYTGTPKNTWGDKVIFHLCEGGAWGREIASTVAWHSIHDIARGGWREGEIRMVPGQKYAIWFESYKETPMQLFCVPDNFHGYLPGSAYEKKLPLKGDLCCYLAGNANGQIVEMQTRNEEWDIFLPPGDPSTDWGQTFVSHGRSLAGICAYASHAGGGPIRCQVTIREDSPTGKRVGPARTATGHPAVRPHVRYPDGSAPPLHELPEGVDPEQVPHDEFLVAYAPGEVPLTPGKTYYVNLHADQPMKCYVDGEEYRQGDSYIGGKRVESYTGGFHSLRWSMAWAIISYQNADGSPLEVEPPKRPTLAPGANLVLNGGAESGDLEWWQTGGDPDQMPYVDPDTGRPKPFNKGGHHHFGCSLGWFTMDVLQFQEIPVTPGESYAAGLWASHSGDDGESVEMLWRDGPFTDRVIGERDRLLYQTGPESLDKWTHYGNKTIEPTQSTITLIVRYRYPTTSGKGSLHVDDIYLYPAPMPPGAPELQGPSLPTGNLVLNPGAEMGCQDFGIDQHTRNGRVDPRYWMTGGVPEPRDGVPSMPMIDPPTDLPTPANHGGDHRFGISVAGMPAALYQYTQMPVVPGMRYLAGMWVAHTYRSEESAALYWCDGPFGGEEHLLCRTRPEAEPDWTAYRSDAFVPKEWMVTLIIRYTKADSAERASIHVDDVYLKLEAPGPGPPPEAR